MRFEDQEDLLIRIASGCLERLVRLRLSEFAFVPAENPVTPYCYRDRRKEDHAPAQQVEFQAMRCVIVHQGKRIKYPATHEKENRSRDAECCDLLAQALRRHR